MPPFTLDNIISFATEASYKRGQSYYRDGRIFDTTRRGRTLEGRCRGSSGEKYSIQVTLDASGEIEAAACSCPYDWGGICKHTVALLLTYLHNPDSFQARAPVKDALQKRSQEELIALIRQMVERYPDLQDLIDRPVPGAAPRKGKEIDTKPFRRELKRAWETIWEWGDDTLERTIRSVTHAGHDFADAGDWRSACAIYRAVLEECLRDGQIPVHDEGEFVAVLNGTVKGLVSCLDRDEITQDSKLRRAVFDELLEVYLWDIDMGGVSLGDDVPEALLGHLTPKEVPAMRARIEEAQERHKVTGYDRWWREAYEELLSAFDEIEGTDPEDTLQRLRESGAYRLLFEKLLALGRMEDVIKLARQEFTSPYERLWAAEVLDRAGRGEIALDLARETLNKQFDVRLAQWLDGRYAQQGDRRAVLDLRRRVMRQEPSEEAYAALKQAAKALGEWETIRADVLRELEKGEHFRVLTLAHLHDEEWDAVWNTLARVPERQLLWHVTRLDLEVADRSRHARPARAIPVYIEAARREIGFRSRNNYARAAAYLKTVYELYEQIGDEEAWLELIAGIRAEFPTLRALQDELNKAGL